MFEHDLYVVLHLMIAGRLRWRDVQQALGMSPKMVLATLEFDHGTVIVSEAGSKKRASMHLVRGAGALADMDPGGIEPLEASVEALARVLTAANHTLKRALTDPHLVSGVGNAFSDEILHAARLSPLRLTRTLGHDEIERLWIATRETLTRWADRLRQEAAGAFRKVTAFHGAMAVHGRFRQPCPVCGSPVQRIVYAENECNTRHMPDRRQGSGGSVPVPPPERRLAAAHRVGCAPLPPASRSSWPCRTARPADLPINLRSVHQQM